MFVYIGIFFVRILREGLYIESWFGIYGVNIRIELK